MNEIKHIDEQTPQGTDLNIEALYQLCPQCFTEMKDKDGNIRPAVDFDKLREFLGENMSKKDEHYEFTWVGKQDAFREASEPITKTLRPYPNESTDWGNTKNLYIEGNNLDALKLLLKAYAGKVDMIYIDPPYNTGKDFIYHDNYHKSKTEEALAAGDIDETGKRYRRNSDSNGEFHSDWCSMIYARLLSARYLLAPNGIMLISIGEQEIDNLKKIVCEVFGSNNYIETYIWESTFRPDNSSKIMRRNAEYVLCVAKNKSLIKELKGLSKAKEGLPSLTKSSMKESILTFPANKVTALMEDGLYTAGVRDSYELLDDVTVKDHIIINEFRLRGRMIWGQENLENELKNGTEIIIKTDGFVPYTKKKGDSEMSPTKIIPNSVVGDVLSANTEMSQLFDKKVFSYPKPVTLLKYLIEYLDYEKMTVMDFFSGSSTTAHAVMKINAENNNNNIKYIMVQLPENLDKMIETAEPSEKIIIQNAIELCNEKNVPHLLTEVAKERIRRAGAKIKEEYPLTAQNLDTGFRVLKVDSSNMTDVYFHPKDVKQEQLDAFATNIKDDRTSLDLLFDCMLRWGIRPDMPLLTEKIEECDLQIVNKGDLIGVFNGQVTDDVVHAVAKKNPLRVVFRDDCFANSNVKLNVYETFKQECGWSDEEAKNNIRVI